VAFSGAARGIPMLMRIAPRGLRCNGLLDLRLLTSAYSLLSFSSTINSSVVCSVALDIGSK
jgi:hypothetical protein